MLDAVWIQALAILTAATATTSAAAAVATLRAVYRTRRAVFGEAAVDHDNGLVGAVVEHEERLDDHEAVLISMGEYPITDGGERPEDGTEPSTVASVELPDGATEADTERDGFLLYAGEWHALVLGGGAGLAAGATGNWQLAVVVASAAFGVGAAVRSKGTVENPSLPAIGEVKQEPWYACAGLLVGTVVGALLGRFL